MLFMPSKGFALAWTQLLLDATVLSGLAVPCFSLDGHALDTLLQMSISDCTRERVRHTVEHAKQLPNTHKRKTSSTQQVKVM